jgi:hypothetical protein
MHWFRHRRASLPIVAAIFVIATALAGFAFKPGQSIAAQPRLLTFADGTTATLCIGGPDSSADAPAGTPIAGHHQACDFCHLASAPGLPPAAPAFLYAAVVLRIEPLDPPAPAVAPRPVFRANTRAPPLAA